MATILTTKQKEVIRKIIYAVETGGQEYGKQNYASLIAAGTNTSNEKAITIGAGQWYATEAKTLLDLIRKTYPAKFKTLDTQNISNDLDTKNWSTYNLSVSSAKAKCIIAIISSNEGIKCQDTLMETQITNYAASIQKTYGTMSADAIAECINIKHQGGDGALKRILAKTTKPYSAKTIYAALCTDPDDKSNNNQVGDYTTRQKKVYAMITTYLLPISTGNTSTNTTTNTTNSGGTNMTENELRTKVANWLVKYCGIKEGSAEHKAILAVFNNSKLCTRYTMTINDAWCATAVSAAFIACGLASIFPCVECSCYYMIEYAKKAGIWVEDDAYTPKVGDVILYDWSDGSNYATTDNKNTPDHVGIVYSISGTSIKVIEGNMSNTIGYRNIVVNGRYIRGYITPKYSTKATSSTPTTSTGNTTSTPTVSNGTALNKTEQWVGIVTASELNVRTWAGTENATCSFSPLKKNEEVSVCDSVKAKDGVVWYYIKYKEKYGFVSSKYISKKTASSSTATNTSAITNDTKVDYASSYNKSIAGTYKTTAALNLRAGAGTSKKSLCVMPKGSKVVNYGYYSTSGGVKWYYVSYKDANGKSYLGFCSSEFLSK